MSYRLFLFSSLLLASGGTDVGEIGEYLLGVLGLTGAGLTAEEEALITISSCKYNFERTVPYKHL